MLPSPPSSPLDNLDLAELLRPVTLTQGPALTFRNWATTFRSITAATFRPETVEQVRWVVELARREGKELRAAGAGHSPSDIVCTEGYIVDLKGLNKVLEVRFLLFVSIIPDLELRSLLDFTDAHSPLYTGR
jgi:L-gulonolactone oxidase